MKSVTIGIEAWNAGDLKRRWLFESCFNSLKAQTYPLGDCELLLAIDSKTTSEEESSLTAILPAARVLRIPNMTYFRAKNAILRAASSEYIVLADSDMTYENRWLQSLISCLKDGKDLVCGKTVYSRGFLHRSSNLCDWAGTQIQAGPTQWFAANNLGLRKSLADQITFREDFGQSGGGGIDAIRQELWDRNVTFWFCAEALGTHDLPPLFYKRLRVGAFHIRLRELSHNVPLPWLIRVRVFAPFLITAGITVRVWQRTWRLRKTLPGGFFAVPIFCGTTAFLKFVEGLGTAAYAWAPHWVNRRKTWFQVPGTKAES